VQVHDEALDSARAGQRVAVNLTGVAVDELSRGDVLSAPGAGLAPGYLIDASLALDGDREPEPGERVQVHHGTRESPARVTWLGGRYWQLRLERPLMAVAGDRFVIRQIAPPDTLGGGTVLDAHPRRHGPSRELLSRLRRIERGEPAEEAEQAAAQSASAVQAVALSPAALELEARLRSAGVEPPLDSESDPGDLAALRAAGRAVRVSRTLHYHPATLAEVRARVLALARAGDGSVTLAQVRDELGTSRKFAQALLEHLDAERVTIRRGEAHHLRGAGRGSTEAGESY
jgi:selenocysteine-specific elongation factor